jgi:hypothetical protein
MLDRDRERREEDRRRQREEWRVESGVSRGAERKVRWLSRGTDLLRGRPNQRLYGGVAGEVVMEEERAGSNRLRGKALGPDRG